MELVAIDVRPGGAHDSQSGLQQLRPRIWGAFRRAAGQVAAIVIQPISNFMGHYLLEPLAARNISCLGLNTRYLGSDVALLLERAIQDLGAGVQWLRQQGFERIVLIGNSGGGALVSLYQAQAEKLTITHTPAGDPIDLLPQDLTPAQAIVLSAAHLGRSRLLQSWIDPAVLDETDLLATDPKLDMFNAANGPPYSAEFMQLYRAAQAARLQRLEQWALGGIEFDLTHSIAVICAQVTLAGEPMGDHSAFWSDGRPTKLPNSGISVRPATWMWDWSEGCQDAARCYWGDIAFGSKNVSLEPQLRIATTFADYSHGHDPVLDAVLEQTKQLTPSAVERHD